MATSLNTLADRLKTRRLALLLTRKSLAARAGVSTEHIRYVESGRIQTPHTIRRLAEALRCDPLWLAGGIDPAARHAIEARWDEARWDERWEERRAAALERAAGLATCGALGGDERGNPRRLRDCLLFGAGVVVGIVLVVAVWAL